MCRRRIALLILLVPWAGSLSAQEPAAVLQRMEERLDSMQQARALRDSLAFRATYSDTVVAGGLRIATSPRLRPLALAAGEEAWQSLVTRFGPSATVPGAFPVTIFGSSRSTLPKRVRARRVRELARGFERGGAQWIWQTQGADVLRWLRGNVPTGGISPADVGDLAAELLRTPARPNPACFAGDAQACASTLGVRVGADTLEEWFEPGTWPRLAEMMGGELSGPDRAARQRCMQQNDLGACRLVLTPGRVLPPVSTAGRQYLVQLALESGGALAFERLTADTGVTIEHRLAAAAGVPTDTLLNRWSAALRAVPRGPAAPPQELLLGLVWSGLLLAMALRGSRWR